jgi:hypothetical protein
MDEWMCWHRQARLAGPLLLTFLAGCAQILGIDELHSGAPDAAAGPDAMPPVTSDAGAPDGGAGRLRWQIPLRTSFGSVAVDPVDTVVVAGGFSGTVNLGGSDLVSQGSDIWVASFTADGTHTWSQSHGSAGDEYLVGVTVDPLRNIAIRVLYNTDSFDLGGDALPAGGSYATAVASYTPMGEHRWSHGFIAEGGVTGFGLSADGSGSVVFAAEYSGMLTQPTGLTNAGGSDVLFARINGDGVLTGARSYGGGARDSGSWAAFDNLGSVYLTGSFSDGLLLGDTMLQSAGSEDVFIARATTSGDVIWALSVGGMEADGSTQAVADGAGNLIVTGNFEDRIQFPGGPELVSRGDSDVFVTKLAPDGTHLWSLAFGGPGTEQSRQIATGPDGRIAVCGELSSGARIGDEMLPNAGFIDAYVAVFEPDGALQWARAMGSVAEDRCLSVAIMSSGAIVAGIGYTGTIDLGGGPVSNDSGNWNSAVVVYEP